MTDLVTFGETMARLASQEIAPLRHADTLRVGIAGAESNVAIGARRLGATSAWIGRVGDDELGRRVLRELRAEDVDVHAAVVDPDAPTGLMIKERRSSSLAAVVYYRRGSAGSRLTPDDLDTGLVAGARLLHCTGITPALSGSARAATFAAVDIARAADVGVSFDPNYRRALWPPDEAAAVFRDLTKVAEVVFAGEDEATMILGEHLAPEEAASRLCALGPAQAVVKLGPRGAVACAHGMPLAVLARRVVAVDAVGAGDAFAAGYLAGLLAGGDPAAALDLGADVGAWAVTVEGDWEGLPTRAELHLLDSADGHVHR